MYTYLRTHTNIIYGMLREPERERDRECVERKKKGYGKMMEFNTKKSKE